MNFLVYFLRLGFIVSLNLRHCLSEEQFFYFCSSHYIKYNFPSGVGDIPYEMNLVSASNITYKICLYEDETMFSSAAKIFIYGNKEVRKLYLRNLPDINIYTGYWKPNGATIFLYKFIDTVIGRLQEENDMYYMEPIEDHPDYFINKTGSKLLFNLKDVMLSTSLKEGSNLCQARKKSKDSFNLQQSFGINTCNSSFSFENLKPEKSCSVELLADHTFFEHMDSNSGKTVAEMIFLLEYARSIFLKADINEDGKPDKIGFNIEKITVFESKDEPGYPLAQETDDEKKFIEYLAEYKHPYCMLICFTHRNFKKGSLTRLGSVSKIGGICHDDSHNDETRCNVGFVTSLHENKIIKRAILASNLAYQLGKAFGSKSDPENSNSCSPGDADRLVGNYIMNEKTVYGNHQNNWKFSSCSIKSIQDNLKNKGECLEKFRKSICGNGIVEEGEACDCDSSTGKCQEAEKCCVPKGFPNECTLRIEKNVECMPDESQCCDASCSISTAGDCFSNIPCLNASNECDGKSPFCAGKLQDNGLPCIDSGVCHKGHCLHNPCEFLFLQPCECSGSKECHICCKNQNDVCQTAKELGLPVYEGLRYVKETGMDCNNKNGKCTSNGICEAGKSNVIIYVLGVLIPVLLCIAVGGFFVYKGKLNIRQIFRIK